jgi:broad specificity phosphatase PhoE
LPETLPRLVLIRHGDTAWSDSGQHTGRTDLPLNDRGIERAKKLAPLLAGQTFAKVFTSPLQRAHRTCELAGLGGGAILSDDLLEWDYGDYEGLVSAQIRERHPGWHLFRDGTPHGESPADVAARADHFIATVRGINGDVAAFGSGHIIRMIAARWIGVSPQLAGGFYTSTASIGVLSYEHVLTQPVIHSWNHAV